MHGYKLKALGRICYVLEAVNNHFGKKDHINMVCKIKITLFLLSCFVEATLTRKIYNPDNECEKMDSDLKFDKNINSCVYPVYARCFNNHGSCPQNAYCDPGYGCQCDENFIPTEDKLNCVKDYSSGDSCIGIGAEELCTNQWQTELICTNGTCECPENKFWNGEYRSCVDKDCLKRFDEKKGLTFLEKESNSCKFLIDVVENYYAMQITQISCPKNSHLTDVDKEMSAVKCQCNQNFQKTSDSKACLSTNN